MRFNPGVLKLARYSRERGLKLALVTINADVFTRVVVPSHRLDDLFDVIVNSADRRELDKRALWHRAFEAMGSQIGFHNSLLIDDSMKCVKWFRELGGDAYCYRGDRELEQWLRKFDRAG